MDPRAAAKVLEGSLRDPGKPLTIADAATQSGLALRDAERGLHALTSEYRGHLRVTEDGDLLFLFPYGFTKPWETRDAVAAALRAIGRGASGVARFLVRAWLTIAIFAYAAIFLGILIGLTLARQGSSSSRDDGFPGASLVYVVFRVLGDALFWTFHPFSPLAIGYDDRWGARDEDRWGARDRGRFQRARRDETPFYEKVNRFVFGPPPEKEDPRAMERRILAEVRALKGRIGLADVMRTTGLPREEADPLMARLMLDYDGEVDVSEAGGITYRFEAIRKTATSTSEPRPRPAWLEKKKLAPLTGNPAGSNVLIALLNGFNLLMGLFALDANLTIARLRYMLEPVSRYEVRLPMPYDGVPILLGVLPLVFSLLIFLLPAGRALLRRSRAIAIAKENGRLGLLQEILARIERRAPLTEAPLKKAWAESAGAEPDPKVLTRAIVDLGGDVEIEKDGEVRYRFVDLETEAAALEAERAAAADEEARVGKVIFGSDR